MIEEIKALETGFQPHETLLVVDAMTGQEAVHVAEEFGKATQITGFVLTKLDGDARGGAALSIRAVTGLPIKFIGTGERADALEAFHPDRFASRILGMGDVLTLIEKAQAQRRRGRHGRLRQARRRRTSWTSTTSCSRCSRCARWARSATCWA